jgi:hypothetical protein
MELNEYWAFQVNTLAEVGRQTLLKSEQVREAGGGSLP